MQKRRSRADRWWEARCRQGVNRPGGASERSTAGEAVQLLKAGGTQNLRSRCDRHGWKRLRTGVPCARCMLPLESRMREIRTSSSVSYVACNITHHMLRTGLCCVESGTSCWA